MFGAHGKNYSPQSVWREGGLRGEIVFGIYSNNMEFGEEMDAKLGLIHTDIGKKGDFFMGNPNLPISINSWRYEMSFCGCDDFTTKARDFSESLKARKEVIAELQKNKDYEVRITFYIRAGDNQIGYALDAETMNNLSTLKLDCGFDLILWGEEDDV